ncbi:MAG: DUF6470 family protein [Bacillota bacterium]
MAMVVRINQVPGQLNLNITPPKLNLQTKPKANFEMSKKPGRLEIKTRDAKVEISTRQARAALNHKFHKIYSKDIAQQGYQEVMQGIAKYAQQGDQLSRIENKGQPLISQAKSNSEDPKREIGLKRKPGAEVKITPGDVQMNYNEGQLNVKFDSFWPQGELDWGKIESYLEPKPQLEIETIDVKA